MVNKKCPKKQLFFCAVAAYIFLTFPQYGYAGGMKDMATSGDAEKHTEATSGNAAQAPAAIGEMPALQENEYAPIYKIVVPTDLQFTIDPFKMNGSTQIYSDDFDIINKSNVPICVDVKIQVIPGPEVMLVNSLEDVSEADVVKRICMLVEVPGGIFEQTTDGGTLLLPSETATPGDCVDRGNIIDTVGVIGNYATSRMFSLPFGEANLTFALKNAEYHTFYDEKGVQLSAQYKNNAKDCLGSATFRFTGAVNSKALWNSADVRANIVYEFQELSGKEYEGYLNRLDGEAHNLVVGGDN